MHLDRGMLQQAVADGLLQAQQLEPLWLHLQTQAA